MIMGAVEKQSPFVLQQANTSLMTALSQAGGLDKLAGKQSGIFVFRPQQSENGKVAADVYTLDLSKPDGMLLANEFMLQPRDVVYVQATEFSQYNAIITQLLPTVTTIFELHQLTK
jgi:polysaccharide export outer membrane protein